MRETGKHLPATSHRHQRRCFLWLHRPKSIVLSGTGTENSFALPTYDTQNGLGNYNFSPENLFLTGVTALEDDQITQCRTWGKMTWANIYYNYKGSPSLAEATITELTNPENYTKVTDK